MPAASAAISVTEMAWRLHPSTAASYDHETLQPAVRTSICTGEKTAGFVNRKDGHFSEVLLIRSNKDLDEFLREYGIERKDLRWIY